MAKNLPFSLVYRDFSSVALTLFFTPVAAVPVAAVRAWWMGKTPHDKAIVLTAEKPGGSAGRSTGPRELIEERGTSMMVFC
mmetsp:Transcript_41404/g.96989  ORF Transcript_41404/g.96989 Transcript_41404/m.96989 type:complete len:81 (-) Transcript_41404:75-317(-)